MNLYFRDKTKVLLRINETGRVNFPYTYGPDLDLSIPFYKTCLPVPVQFIRLFQLLWFYKP